MKNFLNEVLVDVSSTYIIKRLNYMISNKHVQVLLNTVAYAKHLDTLLLMQKGDSRRLKKDVVNIYQVQ